MTFFRMKKSARAVLVKVLVVVSDDRMRWQRGKPHRIATSGNDEIVAVMPPEKKRQNSTGQDKEYLYCTSTASRLASAESLRCDRCII